MVDWYEPGVVTMTTLFNYGENQCNLLDFAFKYPGWHTFAKDRATRNAVAGLVRRGLIEVQGRQFKFSPKSA